MKYLKYVHQKGASFKFNYEVEEKYNQVTLIKS